MRKILVFALLAILVFVVSACGNNNPAPVPQQQPTPPATTQTTPPTTGDTGTADNNAADVAAPFEVDPAVYAEGQRLWEEFYELANVMAADSNNEMFFNIFRAWENSNAERFVRFTNGDASDFMEMYYFEQFLWVDTYLRIVEAMYDSVYIETADRFRQFTFCDCLPKQIVGGHGFLA